MGQRADEIGRFDDSGEGGSSGRRYEGGIGESSFRDDEDRTEEIRDEIEQTRIEMSETIDAIQERLSPQHIKDQAQDVVSDVTQQTVNEARQLAIRAVHDTFDVIQERLSSPQLREQVKDAISDVTGHAVHEVTGRAREAVRDATIGRVEHMVREANDTARGLGAGLRETIQANPIPAAIAAVSLGWLFMSGSGGSREGSSHRRYLTDRRGYSSRGYGGGQPGRATTYDYGTAPRASSFAERGTQTYGDRGAGYAYAGHAAYAEGQDQDQGTVSELRDRVAETAGQVRDQVTDAASSAREFVGDVGDQAGEMFEDAYEAVGSAGSSVLDTIRENPLPSALVGIGLGWLLLNRSGGSSRDRWADVDEDYAGYYPAYGYRGQGYRYAGRGYRAGVGGEEAESGLAERVGGVAGDVGDSVSQAADELGERAGDLADQAQHQVQRAQGQLERMVQDNPLASGALALALGAAVGLAIPSTPGEGQLMGEARERFVDRAQTSASEAMQGGESEHSGSQRSGQQPQVSRMDESRQREATT